MELRHLRYFVAVGEELHFGRAANKLHIAQPALSLQIQSLEKELGVKLLIRNTRSVELTDAVAIFFERSRTVLNDVETSAILARVSGGKDISRIRIGTIYPATFGFLHRFVSRIRDRYPEIQLHIKSDTTDNIVRDLEKGNLNIGFVRPSDYMGSLSFKTILKEQYLLAISTANPLAKKKVVAIEDLKAQRIIAFARSNLTYTEKYFGKVFHDHDLLENIDYTCEDTLSLVTLVSAGIGVGFVPEWAHEFASRSLVLRKVAGIDFDIGLCVAWNNDDPVSRKEEILEIAQSFSS
jgi:DNA-binding transcriptional LysR family regulator